MPIWGDVTSLKEKIAKALFQPKIADIDESPPGSHHEEPQETQTRPTDIASSKSQIEKFLFTGPSPPIDNDSLGKTNLSPPVHDSVRHKEQTPVDIPHPNIPPPPPPHPLPHLPPPPLSLTPSPAPVVIPYLQVAPPDTSNPIPITNISHPRPHVTPPPPPPPLSLQKVNEISGTRPLISPPKPTYTHNETSNSRPLIGPPQPPQRSIETSQHRQPTRPVIVPHSDAPCLKNVPVIVPHIDAPYPKNIPVIVPHTDAPYLTNMPVLEFNSDTPYPTDNVPVVSEKVFPPPGFPVGVVSHTNFLDNAISLDKTCIGTTEQSVRVRKPTTKERKKKKKKKEKRTDKEHLPAVKGNPTSLFNRLFFSGRSDEPCIKAIFGVICGITGGAMLFCLLTFSFKYPYNRAAWITLAFTIILILGLVFSSFFRCMILMALPNLFTGRGRALLMTVIIAVIIAGPFVNITQNFEEVSTSLACITEMAKDASQALKNQLEEPFRQIYLQIKETVKKLNSALKVIEDALEPIIGILTKLQDGFETAIQALKNITVVS